MTIIEAKQIFLQSLPELSEPLKSAVEFTLANWHNLNREPRASDVAINFFASLPALPSNDVDETFAAKLNEMAKLLRDDQDVWLNLDDLPHEEWRDVVGYEGLYQVSNFGRVKSFQRGRKTIRKISFDDKGYATVDLNKNGKRISFSVYVLVARAFIPNPENKREVNHRIADKKNSCIFNLEWATRLENMQHASKSGLLRPKYGARNYKAKLTNDDVRYIRSHHIPRHPKFSARALARKFDIAKSTVLRIINREVYADVV